MKKVLSILVALMMSAPLVLADSTWKENEFQSEQYVLNKCYESATNTLSAKVSGTVITADITAHRIRIYDDLNYSNILSIDNYASYATINTSGASVLGIQINNTRVDSDILFGSSLSGNTLFIDGGTSRVSVGGQVPCVSLDVMGAVKVGGIDNSNVNLDVSFSAGNGTLIQEGRPANTIHQINCYSATNADMAVLELAKSDSNSVNTLAQTDDGDILGDIRFNGVGTGGTIRNGGVIRSTQVGNAAATYIPNKLELNTTNNGGTQFTTVQDSNGRIGIDRANPSAKLEVNGVISSDSMRLKVNTASPDITSGTPSLVVSQDTDGTIRLNFYNGTVWRTVNLI